MITERGQTRRSYFTSALSTLCLVSDTSMYSRIYNLEYSSTYLIFGINAIGIVKHAINHVDLTFL